jgi:molybdate transport system regulatory protein
MPTPVVRFRIDFAKNVYVGPGKIDLLEAIRDSGSLSQAARNMRMSYRRAWLLVESLKTCFREPVTVATTGGKGGGGVALTKFGETLIKSYRLLEQDIAAMAVRRLQSVIASVETQAPARSAAPRRPLVHGRA